MSPIFHYVLEIDGLMAANESLPLLPANQVPPVLDDGEGRTLKQRKIASYLIIAAKVFERLVFHSISGTFLLYLRVELPVCLSNTEVLVVLFLFNAISNVFCLVAGVISDSFISRYTSIIIGYIIYLIGYGLLGTFIFYQQNDFDSLPSIVSMPDICRKANPGGIVLALIVLVILPLFITSIAAAIVTSNLAAFGASQVEGLADNILDF